MAACRALRRRLDRLAIRLRPEVAVIWILFTSEGNLSSVAMSDGSRLEGEPANRAYQVIGRTHPCKVYIGIDPDAALGRLPVHGA
jgi:hypothetical protein